MDVEEFSDIRLPPQPLPVTYNAAPQSMQPIVRLAPESGELEVVMARNALIQPLHDRMPCIIEPRDYLRWLNPESAKGPTLYMLQPFAPEKMRSWRVDKAVGNVKNDRRELINEVAASESYATPSLWD